MLCKVHSQIKNGVSLNLKILIVFKKGDGRIKQATRGHNIFKKVTFTEE